MGEDATSSVRPVDVDENQLDGASFPEEDEEEDEDVDVPEEFDGEVAERIGLEKEGEYIRKLVDPKLPTQEEVHMHNLKGHVEYRN